MKPLTERQRENLNWIIDFFEKNGYSPSVTEIAEGLGMRTAAGARDAVLRLELLGYMERRDKNTYRSLQVLFDADGSAYTYNSGDYKAKYAALISSLKRLKNWLVKRYGNDSEAAKQVEQIEKRHH